MIYLWIVDAIDASNFGLRTTSIRIRLLRPASRIFVGAASKNLGIQKIFALLIADVQQLIAQVILNPIEKLLASGQDGIRIA